MGKRRNVNRQTEEDVDRDGLSAKAMLQRQAVQKLHGDKSLAMLVVNLVDGANAGPILHQGLGGIAAG